MSWNAKPSGGYAMSSAEGTANILEIADIYRARGYTDEAISGVLGNMNAESAFNPWRWEGDVVNYSHGYGLFQYTPASGYINLTGVPNHAPNLSTSSQTAGARATDGIAQVNVQIDDTLSKWVPACWRYGAWSTTTYAQLYAYRSQVLQQWGSGNSISQAQFAQITDIRAATFVFLACFEGPSVPNLEPRVTSANAAYQIIQGHPPGPSGNIPKWLLFKIKWR